MNRFVRLSAIRRSGLVLALSLIALAALLSACDLVGNADDEGDAAEQQAVEQQAAPEAEADEEPARVRAPLPPEPTSFDAATIFSIVRPSLALVQTDQGVATGLATRTGEVFVGASAIAGATTISVTFSNGRIAEDVSVTQIDYVADLAVLGPVGGGATTGLPLVNLGDGEALPIGSPRLHRGIQSGRPRRRRIAQRGPAFAPRRVGGAGADADLLGRLDRRRPGGAS